MRLCHLLARKAAIGSVASRSASTAVSTSVLSTNLESVPPTYITTLENGLRIATQATNFPTATLGVYVDGGARFERKGCAGAANLIEHLLFRGTKSKSGADVVKSLSSAGAKCSISSNREIVGVDARFLAADLDKVLPTLADVVVNPAFKEDELDAEKNMVIRQIQAQNSNYKDWVMDCLHTTAFTATPLESGLFGLTDNILGLTSEDLANHHRDNWVTGKTIIVGVGPINHGELVERVQGLFAKLPTNPEGPVGYAGPSRFTSAFMNYRDDSLPLCYAATAWEGLGASDPRNTAVEVAKAAIGSFKRSRDPVGEHGRNYINEIAAPSRWEGQCRVFEFDFFNLNYRDNGLIGAYWAMEDVDWVPNNTIHHFFWDQCRIAMSCTEEEVYIGKELAKTALVRADTSMGTQALAAAIGRDILYTNDRKPLAQRIREIESVTADDIMKIWEDLFYDETVALACVGKTEQMATHVDVNNWTSRWLR